MEEQDIEKVVQEIKRAGTLIDKYVEHLIDKTGPVIAISVLSNITTTLMATTITMVETQGVDVEEFVRILMQDTSHKHKMMSSQVQTEAAMEKMMTPSGPNPSSNIH